MVNRPDLTDVCYQAMTIDSLSYAYASGSNKLITVTDKAPCPDVLTLPATIDRDAKYAAGQIIRVEDTDVLCNVNLRLTAGNHISVIDTLKLPKYCGTPALVTALKGPCPDDKYTDGFNQQSLTEQYTYDNSGSLTYDPHKKLTFLYNHHNLPYRIIGAENDELQMLYSADGTLLQKKYLKNNATISKIDYLRGVEYKNGVIEAIYHNDGRVVKTGLPHTPMNIG
ncbi:MAG: hypothetical protein IPL08_13995 [Saprospiraceae bacterium]|nr:hypothetical protein [Saprospiraceae bacterium]